VLLTQHLTYIYVYFIQSDWYTTLTMQKQMRRQQDTARALTAAPHNAKKLKSIKYNEKIKRTKLL